MCALDDGIEVESGMAALERHRQRVEGPMHTNRGRCILVEMDAQSQIAIAYHSDVDTSYVLKKVVFSFGQGAEVTPSRVVW